MLTGGAGVKQSIVVEQLALEVLCFGEVELFELEEQRTHPLGCWRVRPSCRNEEHVKQS